MKKYIVSAQVLVKEEVEANGLDEARFKFKEEYPQHKYPEFFDCGDEENAVYGYCENTGLPIFEHDNFEQDSEGVMWLVDDRFYTKGVLINSEIPKLINERMKLELKHVASYLPYDVRAITTKSTYKNPSIGVVDYWHKGDEEISISTNEGYYLCSVEEIKLVLKPLSDLYKPLEDGSIPIVVIFEMIYGFNDIDAIKVRDSSIFVNDEDFTWIDEFNGFSLCGEGAFVTLETLNYLFQHHFDVYGLINNNLAIDSNNV